MKVKESIQKALLQIGFAWWFVKRVRYLRIQFGGGTRERAVEAIFVLLMIACWHWLGHLFTLIYLSAYTYGYKFYFKTPPAKAKATIEVKLTPHDKKH